MNQLARQLEEIFRKQPRVSSEEFWEQVEASRQTEKEQQEAESSLKSKLCEDGAKSVAGLTGKSG